MTVTEFNPSPAARKRDAVAIFEQQYAEYRRQKRIYSVLFTVGFVACNVASGEPHTIGDLAAALCDAFDAAPPHRTGQYRLGDVRHIFGATARAAALLGFRASVSFASGVREFASDTQRASIAAGSTVEPKGARAR